MARFVLSFIIGLFLVGEGGVTAQQPVVRAPAAGTDEWVVEGAGRTGDAKVETFLGRTALWLRNSTQAIKSGVEFADGTIEFDVAPMAHGDFVAIVFRRESLANHENIYLRTRASGEFMAVQYAPRLNGSSTWQLYPEFTAKTNWPREQWTHVRIDVRGSALDVFVGDGQSPVLSVPRLRHPSARGEVGFWARVNDQPLEWAAALANIQIRPAAVAAPRMDAQAPRPGLVANWEVAAPVPSPNPIAASLPSGLEWTAAEVEESGLINLNRLFRAQPQVGRRTAFLRTVMEAATAKRLLAGIGYSDDVTVFVNGEPVYLGINGWNTRMPEFVSFVDPRFERVWLPLRAGRNEIILAISDDQRFGWGAAMSLDRPLQESGD